MRSRVTLGICLADGASFRTAETVPGERPTCAATAFSVTAPPFESTFFLFSVMFRLTGKQATPARFNQHTSQGVSLYGNARPVQLSFGILAGNQFCASAIGVSGAGSDLFRLRGRSVVG